MSVSILQTITLYHLATVSGGWQIEYSGWGFHGLCRTKTDRKQMGRPRPVDPLLQYLPLISVSHFKFNMPFQQSTWIQFSFFLLPWKGCTDFCVTLERDFNIPGSRGSQLSSTTGENLNHILWICYVPLMWIGESLYIRTTGAQQSTTWGVPLGKK